ncbi:hypothetical protein D3C79_579580 [compost metagenome]
MGIYLLAAGPRSAVRDPAIGPAHLQPARAGVSIETIERDSLLDVLYRLGELVEIPRESFYLEAWRGDW